MIKGKLKPLPLMRDYVQPVPVELRYCRIVKDPFPTPQEAQVLFCLGDRNRSAFVPLSIVNEERGTVVANLIGEREGKIVVTFPPTNFGRTTFSAYEAELDNIAIESEVNEN